MRRIMSLFLPRWPTDRRERSAARPDRPGVLAAGCDGRRLVTAVNAAAAQEGLAPGMSLADARALHPNLVAAEADFAGDAAALAALARWCNRFSPWASPHGSDGLVLDITGCAHLFSGEAGLAALAAERLQRRGIESRIAVADSLGAAWALSHFGRTSIACVPAGETQAALADLPVAALRLTDEIAALLKRFGLRRIGDLYDMPRAPLALRCGEAVTRRLDEALGLAAAEPLSPLTPERLRWSRRSFAEPIATSEDIAAATRELLKSLCRCLAQEDRGARKLVLALYRVDGRVEETAVGTARPSRDADHLWRLIEERLPALDPGLGLEDMVLIATIDEKLGPAQLGFKGVREKGKDDLALLLDRLANRFGTRALAKPVLRETHLPERAVRFLPALDGAATSGIKASGAKLRPVRLLSRPEAIEAMAPVPDDPPLSFRWRRLHHRVRRADGPERIADEWWREAAAPRDYYRVEDEEGRRFWLYRAGLYRPQVPPRWFLHGIFA
jgi:protein ImuB